MNPSPRKIKLVIFGALLIALILLSIAICELVSISSMKKEIEKQNKEIESLQNQINYYNQSQTDNKDFDYVITEAE